MANHVKGEIVVELDKPRIWRLRARDVAEIEHALEQLEKKRVTWYEFRARIQQWSVHDQALVLWAGLRHEDPGITPDFVMDNADYLTLDRFVMDFGERLQENMPEGFKKKAAEAGLTVASPTTSPSP